MPGHFTKPTRFVSQVPSRNLEKVCQNGQRPLEIGRHEGKGRTARGPRRGRSGEAKRGESLLMRLRRQTARSNARTCQAAPLPRRKSGRSAKLKPQLTRDRGLLGRFSLLHLVLSLP